MPHYGAYHMMWKRRYPMFIVHLKEKEALAAPVRRSLTITIWGKRDRNILYKMLDEARQEFDDSHPEKTQFYVTRYETWHKLTNVGERKIDTLYLPERMMADLLADVGGFLASREKYTRIGIPYRLGLLFEGPPGTGKTSLVQGLATHFSIPIYSLVISASSSGDDIAVAIARTRNPSILLFEDIDTLSVVRARKPSQKNVPESRGSSITLTDLLNVLDGIGAGENRIVIMTTNHPENLDPALVRSGRIDRKFHIGYAEDTELRRFYNVVSEEFPFPPWEEFRKSLPAKATIADAQSFALRGSITTSA
jgi:chaperone BCS1